MLQHAGLCGATAAHISSLLPRNSCGQREGVSQGLKPKKRKGEWAISVAPKPAEEFIVKFTTC